MRWFGGFCDAALPPRAPANGVKVWPNVSGFWTVGRWAENEVRTAHGGNRIVALIGPCGIDQHALSRLGVYGVPDDVAWRWPGSYTTIEVAGGDIRIWTDLGGAWPVYMTSADGGVYWSSSSRALAGLTNAGPDLDRLSVSLLAPSVPLLLAGRSAFDGVELVPAGHRLTLERAGAASVERMWSPRPRSGSAGQRLRAELAAAVDVRADMATDVTADMSGGYDSTSLALLAHESSGDRKSVTGVTVHPVERLTGGDVDYARLAARNSGIAHRLMPLGAEHAPYTALTTIPVTDEPAPSTIAYARFSGQLEWMRDTFGTDCHLTGDGGDSLLYSPPIIIADLFATGRSRRAIAETVRWARFRKISVWPLLRSADHVSRGRRSDALAGLAARLRGDFRPAVEGDIGWCEVDPLPSWATAVAAARLEARVSALTARVEEPASGCFSTTVTSEGIAEVGRSARADIQIAESLGVPLHNPFTDSRVVDTYLSIPLGKRPGPAEYKPVLREAMADLFPAKLAARITKGDFNPDHYEGMRVNLASLHDLADGRLAALNLIDVREFRRTLTMTAAGLPVPFASVEPAVTAEVWLRALETAPAVEWMPAQDATEDGG